MQIALIHSEFSADHLAAVVESMKALGAPVIKAVWMEAFGHFAALEGCHRIRAAAELGLTPIIEEIEYSEETTTADLGLDFGGDSWTVAELADESRNSVVIEF